MRRRIFIRMVTALTLAALLLLPAAALAGPQSQGAPAMLLMLLGAARKASAVREDQTPKPSHRIREQRPAPKSAIARVAVDADKTAASGSPQTGR